ncbi:hypothetical protein PoB_002565400 [Plakobranchus ocellatus]|uniref:Uncharacterized protein n=1 Tax=Plakobranchus ocellatus TaxID=259542 RepID=A0AAV3ZUY5_9GAST|nr:hypothetical protein PoB_002565400 [Plakobranchus ocellatus]
MSQSHFLVHTSILISHFRARRVGGQGLVVGVRPEGLPQPHVTSRWVTLGLRALRKPANKQSQDLAESTLLEDLELKCPQLSLTPRLRQNIVTTRYSRHEATCFCPRHLLTFTSPRPSHRPADPLLK